MIRNIQALRAIASLMVVAHHVVGAALTYHPQTRYLDFFYGWGACGVDIFFVISGFVMVYTQSHRPKSPLQFFGNRVARIAPTYWAITTLMLLIFVVHPATFQSVQFSAGRALRSFLFVSVPFDGGPLVYVGWTLEYEMLFYVIFAASIFIGNPVWSRLACIAAFGVLALAGLTMPLEFLFGMVAANIVVRFPKLPIGIPCLLLGVGLLLATIPLGAVDDHTRFIRWGIPAFLIVLGALYIPQTSSRIALYLGAASYSIYLAQIFSISGFYKLVSRPLSGMNGDILAVACIGASAALGCLVYETVEGPADKLIRRYRKRTMAQVAAA